MQRYDSYKNSGVKWLGEIPSHWEMKRWRVLMNENAKKNSDCKLRLQLQFRYGDIVRKANQSEESDVLDTISKYTVVAPNDIMINGLNLNYDFISQRVAQVKEEGVITSAYISLRPTPLANSRYYTYFLKSMDAKKMFHGMGTGIRLTLSYNELKNQFIPMPSLKEQEAIANYLDSATSKIEEAISQQQKMIDLLNERKQIIINNAVTKGLDPNVKMKPSGVDWIGDIPEHWRLIPIKHIIKFINGYAFDSNEFKSDGDVPVIRISNISEGQVSLDDIAYVSYKKELEPYVTQKGDLLIAMSGATTGKVGFVFERGLYINQRVGAIRSEYQQFVFYWLNSTFFKEYVLLSALGSAQPNISSKGISNFQICLPPKDEIEEICRHIKRELNKLTPSISNITKKISLLQERKQIIINDVVTGKEKVI